MTSLYEILKSSKIGAGTAPDMYTALMAKNMPFSKVSGSAKSWREFRKLVRSGKAPTEYPIGTILYDDWGNDQSTAFEIVEYDKHFDSDLTAQGYTHSATLQELKLTLRQFDAIEAWLYAETAIPSGTYRFKIPNYDTSYGGNKWYYFTSTADVPVGGAVDHNMGL